MTTIPLASSKLKNYKFAENSFLPRTVTVILRSEKHYSYKCMVKPGDIVEEGEVIACPEDESSKLAFIHSPIPGKVIDILSSYCADGTIEKAVKIEFSGKFTYFAKKLNENDLSSISAQQIQNILIEKGIINTFDIVHPVSFGKEISNLRNKEKKVLVVRLFDDDTTMLNDSLYTKFFLSEIVKGAKAVAKAIETENILFVATEKHGIKAKITEFNIPTAFCMEIDSSKYPAGNEKAICSLFEKYKKKPDFINSISIHDLFVDSGTLYEVYKSVYLGIPSISRYVHFSGNCIPMSCFLNVKNGTTLEEIVGQLGHFVKRPSQIIINGQIRGNSITSLNTPLSKAVKSVYFLSSRKFTDNYMYHCINCGNCRLACPNNIAPDLVYNFTVHRLLVSDNVQKSAILCTQCNMCNSVCPARLPLSQAIAVLKSKIKGTQTDEE